MIYRKIVWGCTLLMVVLGVFTPVRADTRRVLVLNSFHEGYHWTDRIMQGVMSGLGDEDNVEVFVNYMDAKRCSDDSYYEHLAHLYFHKYTRLSFDAIISTDDPALDFLLAKREELFPGVPVVFCGINDFHPERIIKQTGITGVHEDNDIPGTVELMLRLHPRTTDIMVISDATVSGDYLRKKIERAESGFTGKVKFNYLTNLSLPELKEKLVHLSPTSLVLWSIYLRTPEGTSISCEESVAFVAQNSLRPVYCVWDVVGQGVVGGKITSPNYQGEMAAKRVLQVLDGERPEDIPISGSPTVHQFDYQVLKDFGISIKSLPDNSILLNQPYSAYAEHKLLVWLTSGFVLVLVFIILMLFLDIQKRRQAERALLESEEQLRQAEKMSALGQLAGGIAHDFNNQLAGVVGYADLLILDLEDQELISFAEGIKKSALRSAELTAQLLAFSRRGKYLAVPLDVHVVLNEVVSILERSIDKRIKLKLLLKAGYPIIKGDPTQLQNALFNVALNARDAMPDGGEILLETRAVELDQSFCDKHGFGISSGQYINISIADTGCGMDRETQQHIFEPFFTTKAVGKGTGMGLASVYGTVKNHQGAIRVCSEPERGTTIQIYLPVADDVLNLSANNESSEEPVRGSGHILLVDDEAVVRDMESGILRSLGYTVTVCSNGRDAVEYYRKSWKEVDLVLLDMVMSDLNGKETFVALRAINSDVRVILSSGYSINGDAQKILNEGVKAFLGKPYGRTELSAVVARVLAES
ncbi:ABC transporter substrate binding protein [Pontiellaceae bacterium B12227]|nr:ABC transporter substrate binding protein [Pontiellaceae bacterium B12227]